MLQKLIPPTHVYSDVCGCYIRRGSAREARRLVRLERDGLLSAVLNSGAGMDGAPPLAAINSVTIRVALRDICDAVFVD